MKQKVYQSLVWPAGAILLLWVIHLIQVATGISLAGFGVRPRHLDGFWGIFTAPLVHGNWSHLFSNTPPLFAMLAMVLFFYRTVAVSAISLIYVLTGLAVWAFAFNANTFHIGASGVVYGLVSFVFWSGVFRRNLKSIVLALIVVFYYSSMFLGILPGQEGISWESHLYGAIVGMLVSFWFKDRIEPDERPEPPSWELEAPQEERPFFDPNVFEKTRQERAKEQRQREEGGWFSNW